MTPLTVFSFKVIEAGTGVPVANAQCAIQDVPLGYKALEGAGGYTNLNGVCTIDVLFAARYYAVYKAGYVTARGSVPGTQINVSLTPTAVKYWVAIIAGLGGSVNPSGTYQVAANTKLIITATPETGYALDYWLVNNVKSGSTNPLGVTIDKDSYSIYAIFKVAEVPPPPPPPNGGYTTWPVERSLVIVSEHLKAEAWDTTGMWKDSKAFDIGDTSVYVGARIEYSITCVAGRTGLLGANAGISVNGTEVVQHDGFQPGDVFSGVKDIPINLAATGNKLNFGQTNSILNWNEFSYVIKIVFGYSGEPVIEPGAEEPPFWEKLEWWQWGIVGGLAVGGLYVLGQTVSGRGGGQPVIIMAPPYYPRESRREET